MTFCESGRLPEEGTPKLVLKEEQGLVKAEEGSLVDEMGSDAGWPGTHKNPPQTLVGGNEGAVALTKSLPTALMVTTQKPLATLLGLAFS